MSGGRGAARPLSELALVAVHVAVVVGFDRLYLDRAYLGPLLGFTLGAHALAAACRWRGLRPPLVAAIALLGLVLATTWLLFPATSWAGLPTGRTLSAARDSLRLARSQFPQVLAPTAVQPGFQLAAGVALWAAAWFADWAAFRLRATVEAVAPAAVIFVFVSLLGSGQHELVAATSFVGSVLVFVAAHRALRAQLDQAWLTTAPTAGPRAALRAGGLVAVVAVVAGVLAGPNLPGADADAIVNWRGHGGGEGPRVTISPMVELKKRLLDQSTVEVLQVRTDHPTYLRLTSLGVFDGEIFKSSGDYDGADDDLPSDGPEPAASRTIHQEIRIEALADIWVPAAYQLRTLVRSTADLRWEADSSTLIVDDRSNSDGLTYEVISEAPLVDATTLRAAPSDPAGDDVVGDTYRALPTDFPARARALAAQATEGAETRYDQARQLQDWFRTNFVYDLGVGGGHSDDALLDFLDSKRGYCEQFSAAYAAMARTLGIPSRVAVGFTQGDQDPDDPELFHVRGTHAHAWPEVWFPEIGWVPFEPTPGRGMPDAEAHTGVPPQQAGLGDDEPTEPATTTTTAPGPTRPTPTTDPRSTPTQPPRAELPPPTSSTSPSADGGLDARVVVPLVLLALAAAWLAAILLAPAIRRRRQGSGRGTAAVVQAWQRTLDPIRWTTGLRPSPAETHVEFARRAAGPLGAAGLPFERLADLVTATSWSDRPAGGAADEADALATTIGHEVAQHESRRHRLRRRLSYREAFGTPPT